jgi:general secretion pathway protein M
MSAWWNDLSARERMLVSVAGLLAGVLLLTLLIIRPLAAWSSAADRKATQARDAYELTATAAAVAGSNSTNETAGASPLRQSVISTAGSAGIELVRIGSVSEARIEIQTAPADADLMFTWLGDLERHHGVSVVFADMTRGDAGRVNAQILVFERR